MVSISTRLVDLLEMKLITGLKTKKTKQKGTVSDKLVPLSDSTLNLVCLLFGQGQIFEVTSRQAQTDKCSLALEALAEILFTSDSLTLAGKTERHQRQLDFALTAVPA